MIYTVAAGRAYFDPMTFASSGQCLLSLARDSWPTGYLGTYGADSSIDGGATWTSCAASDISGDVGTWRGQPVTTAAQQFEVPSGTMIRPWLEPAQDFSTTLTASAV